MMMHHKTKFGNKMFGDLEDIIWTNINILTLCCDLDPVCSNPFFSQDSLASNDVSSVLVWLPRNQHFDHMSPHCGLDLENSNNNKTNST